MRFSLICAAAVRFGIAPSTAIKWLQQWRRTGSVQPWLRGGDERSHRLESHGTAILALITATPDITLAEIVAHLKQKQRLAVASSTVWRLLDRHGLSLEERRTPPSSSGLTSGSAGWPGSRPSWSWSPSASFSLYRLLAVFPAGIGSGAC